MQKYCKWCDDQIVLTDDEHEDVCCCGECAELQELDIVSWFYGYSFYSKGVFILCRSIASVRGSETQFFIDGKRFLDNKRTISWGEKVNKC